MSSLESVWPPFGLTLTAGPLELRAIRDDDIPELVDLALGGVHEPGQMPFVVPWTEAPPAELPAATARYYWQTRATFTPAAWSLDLVVRHEGVVVGIQGIATKDYRVARTGETGSWLGMAYQGRGIGTATRQALCAFLFDELDAVEIESAAYLDNPRSLAVSAKVGYRDNGTFRQQRRPDELAFSRRLLLRPEDFVRGPDPVVATGVAAFRAAIGLDPPPAE